MNKSFLSALPKRSTVLIKNCRILISESGPLHNQSLFIRGRAIEEIGELGFIREQCGSGEWELDASGCIVFPGIINNHSHIAMSLLRGYAEDLPLLDWLENRVWPAEAKMTPEDVYLGAVAGSAEALLSGTTFLTSIYFYNEAGSEAEAVFDLGLRGLLAHGVFDRTKERALRLTAEMVEAYHGKDDGRIRVATSPHAPYTCSPELLKEIESLRGKLNERAGKKFRILSTTHVAEARNEAQEIEARYKVEVRNGVAAYLQSLGVLNSETIAAHCIHLQEEDILALKESAASVASCPISNLKVGMGVADLPKLMTNGITTSLGTDGPASNNTLDMFETVKMSALLPKGVQGDTTLMNARQTFEIATIGGARSVHQEHQIGTIAKGKLADLVLLDLSHMHSYPLYDPYSHLIFSANSHDVRDVVVDGRILVKDHSIVHFSADELKRKIESRLYELGFKS